MNNTAKQKSNLQNSDDIRIEFFNDGQSEINLGLGIPCPISAFDHLNNQSQQNPDEPDESDTVSSQEPLDPLPDPFTTSQAPLSPVPEPPEPTSSYQLLIDTSEDPAANEDTNTNSTFSEVDYIEESIQRFNHLSKPTQEINKPEQYTPNPEFSPSLDIVSEVSLTESDELVIYEVQKLEQKLMEEKNTLTGSFVHDEAAPTLAAAPTPAPSKTSGAGDFTKWWTQTFIVKPISGTTRILQNMTMWVLSALYRFFLTLMLSLVSTVVVITLVFVIWGHYIHTSPSTLAMQQYDGIKQIIMQFLNDIKSK